MAPPPPSGSAASMSPPVNETVTGPWSSAQSLIVTVASTVVSEVKRPVVSTASAPRLSSSVAWKVNEPSAPTGAGVPGSPPAARRLPPHTQYGVALSSKT